MNHPFSSLYPWWTARDPRERRALLAAAMVLTTGVLWSLGIVPAWRTLRDAPVQQARLAPHWEQMRANAAEAQVLQTQKATPLPRSDSERALQTATQRHLGNTAKVNPQGERAMVTLQGALGDALAQWLEEVRVNARLSPSEAQLTQAPPANGGNADGSIRWSGSIVLSGASLATP